MDESMEKGAEGAPLEALAHFIADPRSLFEFSFYQYIPDSAKDPRRLAWVQGGPGGLERCRDLLGAIEPGEELAMHSKVKVGDRISHIPMLDLACPRLGVDQMERLRKFIDPAIMDGLAFYQSGRSFHAYGSTLLDLSEIYPFWGRALLANPVGSAPVVDARWIGHRMISGYGALRLSARQERSIMAPRAALSARGA